MVKNSKKCWSKLNILIYITHLFISLGRVGTSERVFGDVFLTSPLIDKLKEYSYGFEMFPNHYHCPYVLIKFLICRS